MSPAVDLRDLGADSESRAGLRLVVGAEGRRPVSAGDPLWEAAARLAGSHSQTIRGARAWDLRCRVQNLESTLRSIYGRLNAETGTGSAQAAGAEWFLNNDYALQEALQGVRESLPPAFYRRLPVIRSEAEGFETRVYTLARAIGETCQNPIDLLGWTERFVTAYQQVQSLTIREIWALFALLRLVFLEDLAHQALALVEGPVAHQAVSSTPARVENGSTIGGTIASLRSLASHDWPDVFERISRVEQILRRDPVRGYQRLDFATRDRYRKAVEEIARWADGVEEEVAQRAIDLCGENNGGSDRQRHVGYFLVDEGRGRLEEAFLCRPPWRVRTRRFLLRHAAGAYLSAIGLLTLVVALGLGSLAWPQASARGLIFVILLALIPASSLAVGFVQWLVAHWLPARLLPKFDFAKGIPARHRTLVGMPVVFTSREEVECLLESLEINYLSNSDPHLHFALLSDFADAPRQNMPGDDALLEMAIRGIHRLNQRCSGRSEGKGPFSLLHRQRIWNSAEDCWMGWERKRGKLSELNRLLRGARDTSFHVCLGNLADLRRCRYVITLDADTIMPPGAAARLIGTLAHPLNRPVLDAQGERVVAGYTVLQPRVETSPASAGQSRFTRIFAGDTGLDLYTHAVSDFYQDVFGEGIYTGKGIYDLDAFERCLSGRVPNNSLLSHDLFEGLHGRVALVSDIVLFEDYPPGFLAYKHRLHRWVRGDWQLLPWLWPRVPQAAGGRERNPLPLLGRWKIFDNLRRSLIPPAFFLLLVAVWLGGWGEAWVWTVVLLAILGTPILFAASSRIGRPGRAGPRPALAGTLRSAGLEIRRWLLAIVFLPYTSVVITDGACRALIRLAVTRKRLLEWTTASHAARALGGVGHGLPTWRQMRSAPALAAAVTTSLAVLRPAALAVAAPILLSWLLSPQVAHWISRPLRARRPRLSAEERSRLRRLARRTWLFFEQLVGPSDHWLPPDNFQEELGGVIARKTSPTNVAVTLLATLGAYDLGYLGIPETLARLQHAFDALEQLERHRGHFLNWYETRHLQPLEPRYVSTVDSGNLAGCLLSLRQGLEELAAAQIPGLARREGLLDTLGIVAELLQGLRPERSEDSARATLAAKVVELQDLVASPTSWAEAVSGLYGIHLPELQELLERVESEPSDGTAAHVGALHTWLRCLRHQTAAAQREIAALTPWLPLLARRPRLYSAAADGPVIREAWRQLRAVLPESLPLPEVATACREAGARLSRLAALLADRSYPEELREEARSWNVRLATSLTLAERNAEKLLAQLRELADKAGSFFEDMDFGFLYDRERHLFRIGHDVSAGEPDPNHYELFASEARIASFVAIAKGDVPLKHWRHLGRPLTRCGGSLVLISSGATLFEYLMPGLLIRSRQQGLAEMSSRAAVAAHMRFAARHGIPWGISESGCSRFDRHPNFEYRTFGVPGIGLRRGSGDRLVVAPYASLLALSVDPRAVIGNLDWLVSLNMVGHLGFYEAVDFGHTADPLPRQPRMVRVYMSHHQGMALLALDNFLNGNAMVHRFHRERRVACVEFLLYEQVPHGLVPVKLWRYGSEQGQHAKIVASRDRLRQPDNQISVAP